MRTVILTRLETLPEVTLGALTENDVHLCNTLELPWRQNIQNISCIPPGEYLVRPSESSRYRNSFSVANVPGRTGVLIHAGNTVIDTKGCILVGEHFSYLKGLRAVLKSSKTLEALKALMGEDPFTLKIV